MILYSIFKDGEIYIKSIRYSKRECINSFIYTTKLTWEETKKYGWNCKKVKATFEII